MKQVLLLGLLLLAMGCATNQKTPVTEVVDLHFDLDEVVASSTAPLYLHVNGMTYPISVHDDASFQQLQSDFNALDFAAEEDVTHFVSGVAIPTGQVNHLYVTRGDPRTDPNHELVLAFYHVESAPSDDQTGDSDDENQVYACDVSAAMSMVFNHPELATDDPDQARIVMHHINPVDPALVCDPKQPHRPEIIELAKAINHARKSGGVVVNELLSTYSDVPPADASHKNMYWVKEPDGTSSLVMYKGDMPYYAFRFTDGDDPEPLPFAGDLSTASPAVSYRIRDEVLAAAQPALLIALNKTKNDPALQDVKYTVVAGNGPSQSGAIVSAGDAPTPTVSAGVEASGEQIVLSYSGGIDGMEIELDGDEATWDDQGFRWMRVKVKNYYLRHVALWVKWQAPDGSPDPWWRDYPDFDAGILAFYGALGMPGWYELLHDVSQTDGSVFWGLVANRTVMMGIPLSPDWTTFDIPIPPSSSKAELVFASMGTGQWHNENIVGAILTSIVDLGIPGYFLASGIHDGVDGKPILKDAISNPKVLGTIVGLGVAMGIYGEARGDGANNFGPYAKALGAMLVNTGCDRLRHAIVTVAAKSTAEKGIPFAGWALYLAGLAANTSQLAQTIAEVSSTPAIHRNSLVATWSPKIRILPDPLNIRGGFPESATTFSARILFGEHEAKRLPAKGAPATLGNTAVPHLDFIFEDLPEGGMATIRIDLLSDSGFVSGFVNANIPNSVRQAPPDADGVNYTLQLIENMVNITPSTVFVHKDQIGVDAAGQHHWLGHEDAHGNYVAPPAPTATANSLDCASTDGGLCALLDITLNIQGHAVGYTWQGYAKDIPECSGSGVSSGQRYASQNLSVLNNASGGPESLRVHGNCNYLESRPALAYDLIGDIGGYHVFVFPVEREGEVGHFVSRVAIDASMSLGPQDTAIGRLVLPPTDVAIHPSGFLVSVNRDRSKMEILDIDGPPVPLGDAPTGRLALGEGDRTGLLNDPVAVTVSGDGDILVLEQGNRRVSAFDQHGSVRLIFGDQNSLRNAFDLTGIDSSAVLLDLDVESTGMVFVLGYHHGGSANHDYFVQVYSRTGDWIDTVVGVTAGKMAVDHFRNLFTLNYESILGPDGTIEPSISLWTPLP